MAKDDLDDILNEIGACDIPTDVDQMAKNVAERVRRDLARTDKTEHSKWKAYIMRNRKIQLTAAAVIVVAVLAGLHWLGAPLDGTTVVWGDVLEKIEGVPAITYKMTMTITYPQEKVVVDESEMYWAGRQGTRIDTYRDGELFMIKYWLPASKRYIIVHPQLKRYMEQTLSEEEIAGGLQQQDPRRWLKWILSWDNRELGRSEIDGVEVAGIEATRDDDQETIRFWADIETNLPARMESQGQMLEAGQQMPVLVVMDNFRWHDEIDSGLLDPNIPADYTLSPLR